MQDIYKAIDNYNSGEKEKTIMVTADVIADIPSNIKLHAI